MKKKFYSILIKISFKGILLLYSGVIYGQWQDVGNSGFSDGIVTYNNLKFYNNEPYVAFKDWSNGYGITVKKFNGANWLNIGTQGFSNEVGAFLDFIFHNNELYVAFDDNDNSRVPSVMKFNGSTWESIPSFSTDVAYDINLVSNGGTLYVGYKDFGAQFKATVKKFNGVTWDIVGSRGFTSNGTFSLDLEFNDNVPYVSFIENAGLDENNHYVYKPSVMKFNGTTWELIGNALFTEKTVEFTDLAFYQGQPCISFRTDLTNNQRLAVMTFDGNDWLDLSSDNFTNDYAESPDLKVYNGELYVLYTTGGLGNSYARLKKFNGTNWENINGDLVSNSVATNTSLNFWNNEVYVAVADWGNSRKLTVKKHSLPTLDIDNYNIPNTNNIEVYPIPATHILNIKTDEEVKIFIYDIYGNKVFSSLSNKDLEINISSLNNGIYILKLILKGKIISKKIIIK